VTPRPLPAPSPGEPHVLRWLPLLLVPVALLPDLGAALPLRTYFFRDFGAAFYPLRLFAARELREGRLPAWNPYLFEGSFQLPALYPPDLLHALWPSPAFVSWLLTLHLPLAALAAYWLARELGTSRAGAFLAGAVYALSGFALSCLNLYVFLQALALAPFVAGLLRRAARGGGRSVPGAAAVLGLALSTLAVEFVGQAVLLGVALGLALTPSRAALGRLAFALALGVGVAGLPVALTASLLPETARGAGFAPEVALGNSLHPAVLAQMLLPSLFGFPQAPAEAFWGGRFFSKGLPYFLSLYMGPLTLALAAIGTLALPRRVRPVLLALAALGLWYALGERGGLAPLVSRLPLTGALRFPTKALLLPHLAVSMAAAFAVDRLRAGRAWTSLAVAGALAAAVAVAVAVLLATAPPGFVAWTGVVESYWPHVVSVARQEAGLVVILALAVGAAARAVARGIVGPGWAVALVTGLAVADLARAGAGLVPFSWRLGPINPQVQASFFDPRPELAALRLDDLDGGRIFSYGLDHSPAFRETLRRGGQGLTLTSFYLHRQILGPYANVIDRVEAAEANDLAAFVPRERELSPELYQPGRAGDLLPWLRNAGVARVLSLDPLSHPELVPLAAVPAGPPGVAIHVYSLDTWPRASLACWATPVKSRDEAAAAPYREGFDPWREVALEEQGGEGPHGALPATCTKGRARRTSFTAGEERYAVETDAAAYLVVRASFARGWRAFVDGVPAPVLRANGKHRAVALDAGQHEVVLRYEPPGYAVGLVVSLLSLLAAGLLLLTDRHPRRP
jgi:Bacterial membrane protein YfhO